MELFVTLIAITIFVVLILIIMEDTHGGEPSNTNLGGLVVLILIIMEDTHGGLGMCRQQIQVLILIIMEDTHGVKANKTNLAHYRQS